MEIAANGADIRVPIEKLRSGCFLKPLKEQRPHGARASSRIDSTLSPILAVLSRKPENIFNTGYLGIIFPYALLTPSEPFIF